MKGKISILVLVALSSSFASAEDCWKLAYGRGVGKPISTCAPGLEQNGLLCYPYCRDGFYGVGPVCWQYCPTGFTDTGVDCLKPPAYGRGVGYVAWEEDECIKDHP